MGATEYRNVSSAEHTNNDVAGGAVAGTAIGAGLGAAVGSASGHAGAGALIGGAYGLLIGTAEGSSSGQIYGRQAQRRYDNAYVQCMYSYGNQVPGIRRYVAATPQAAVSPPPPPSAMSQANEPPQSANPSGMLQVNELPPPPPQSAMPQANESAPLVSSPPPTYQTPPGGYYYPDAGQYAPPSDVYVDESPQFLYSSALNMYVAIGVPYDIVYTGNNYFYFYGGRWYRGPYYNGPWVIARKRQFPSVLLRYRIDQIRYYREVESRRYERDRSHYDGRIHRPEYRAGKTETGAPQGRT